MKAGYTKKQGAAKAAIRYIAHRPGKDNTRTTRTLFGTDGAMSRQHAYAVIDEARQGSVFFRFVISPDPKLEDTFKDLYLRGITDRTMQALAERVGKPVSWVGSVHADHAPHRHVHVVAVVPGRLQVQDFQLLRTTATQVALAQRKERDLVREIQKQKEQEAQWALQR